MKLQGLIPALCIALASSSEAQIPESLQRAARIVIHSPHFDEPDPERGFLNCAARPLKLIGYESGSSADSPPRLRIRVLWTRSREIGVVRHVPVPGAVVQLTHRLESGEFKALPDSTNYAAMAKSDGHAELLVPEAIYRVRVHQIGFRSGEGILRIRRSVSDSLQAYIDQAAICEE